jgi:hypothetical protein
MCHPRRELAAQRAAPPVLARSLRSLKRSSPARSALSGLPQGQPSSSSGTTSQTATRNPPRSRCSLAAGGPRSGDVELASFDVASYDGLEADDLHDDEAALAVVDLVAVLKAKVRAHQVSFQSIGPSPRRPCHAAIQLLRPTA